MAWSILLCKPCFEHDGGRQDNLIKATVFKLKIGKSRLLDFLFGKVVSYTLEDYIFLLKKIELELRALRIIWEGFVYSWGIPEGTAAWTHDQGFLYSWGTPGGIPVWTHDQGFVYSWGIPKGIPVWTHDQSFVYSWGTPEEYQYGLMIKVFCTVGVLTRAKSCSLYFAVARWGCLLPFV